MFSLGLIGYPLSYSISPQIHQAALDAMGLLGDYLLFPVPPIPQGVKILQDLLRHVREGDLKGLNVTIPHKQTVIPYLDDLTPTARAVGAVNTIFLQGGNLVGDNTDMKGFLVDLENFIKDSIGGEKKNSKEAGNTQGGALILGAGGAARAVAYALFTTGWDVILAARRLEQAQEVITRLKLTTRKVQLSDHNLNSKQLVDQFTTYKNNTLAVTLDQLSISNLYKETYNQERRIIINTTPVGTWPQVTLSPWPVGTTFPEGTFIYDLIYNPTETELMRQARLLNLPTTNGLGLLIEQAALSLEIWTDRIAPRQYMWQAACKNSGLIYQNAA